ncbi:hypothetical protein ACQP00_05990 [Dactylosporangium sp. CS-047395]|uniref:hypothetical protein n=1 Tax=Dactylosporangium sp. CS-047395 TaxID=3239936 RepID=UPI003D8AC5FB
MDPVTGHWLREWGVPPASAGADLLSTLAAAADTPAPDLELGAVADDFEAFGAGEMALFARLPDDRAAADLEAELADTLAGVALLQDQTHADGLTQWILGRAPERPGQSSQAAGT